LKKLKENQQWYILQVYSNSELAVKVNIENIQKTEGSFLNIDEVYVPIKEVISISPKGKKSVLQKALFPGYVYILVTDYKEKIMANLNRISKISKILGKISLEEVETLKSKVENEKNEVNYKVSFEEGQQIRIKAGSFSDFTGVVDEFIPEKSLIKVNVEIFGRLQEVELDIQDVEMVL